MIREELGPNFVIIIKLFATVGLTVGRVAEGAPGGARPRHAQGTFKGYLYLAEDDGVPRLRPNSAAGYSTPARRSPGPRRSRSIPLALALVLPVPVVLYSHHYKGQ